MEVLRLENLSKFYTSDNAVVMGLTGINLSFSVGEFVALTGESGSGKSTLAHVLGGILPYESGELYVDGQPTSHYDVSDWANYRRDMISFISQSYGILPGNTVSENVENALRLSGLSKEEARGRADAILEEVELTEFKGRKAGKLSSGQKQRLSIARALAKPSKILIADEPTGNLDRENSDKIITLLKKAAKEKLVILITHEFEEAKDVATRRIILADGEVVTDAPLSPPCVIESKDACPKPQKEQKGKKNGALFPYISYLTTKAHPVFTAILCLLLTITTLITFVFLGNFVIALDDTSTKIYDNHVFFNGDPERLIVMRSDGLPLTEEDYAEILSKKYVEKVDAFGTVSDLVYHYKEGVDHTFSEQIVGGPNYDHKDPLDYTIEKVLKLKEDVYSFMQTFPKTRENILTAGRKPQNTYEAVSADPDFKTGDKVTIYVRDPNQWSISSYLALTLDIVGETEYGEGIYVSDQLAYTLPDLRQLTDTTSRHLPLGNATYVFLPYDKDLFPLAVSGIEGDDIAENEFIFPLHRGTTPMALGNAVGVFGVAEDWYEMRCVALHEATFNRLVLVSSEVFSHLVQNSSPQASVYMTDYSYTERVTEALNKEGYIAVSPYQLGATQIDEALQSQRVLTLGICAATFLVTLILQCILLFTMFASLHEYYKLMANTGLTAKTVHYTLSSLLLGFTLLGEVFGGGIILLLNRMGVRRVVDIFKYLSPSVLVILFSLHFILILLSLFGILWRTKRAVFGKNKAKYDIDFKEMEEAVL